MAGVFEIGGEDEEALEGGFGLGGSLQGGGEGAGAVEGEMENVLWLALLGGGDGLGVKVEGFVELPQMLPAFAELDKNSGAERMVRGDFLQALDGPAVIAVPLESDGNLQLEPGILREPLAPGVERRQFQPAKLLFPAAERLLVGGRRLVLDETAGDFHLPLEPG